MASLSERTEVKTEIFCWRIQVNTFIIDSTENYSSLNVLYKDWYFIVMKQQHLWSITFNKYRMGINKQFGRFCLHIIELSKTCSKRGSLIDWLSVAYLGVRCNLYLYIGLHLTPKTFG